MRADTWASLIGLTMALGCGSTASSTAPAAAPLPTPQSLVWSPQGDRLIVDGRLSVPADDGPIESLPTLDGGHVVFGADGQIAQLAPGVLLIDAERIALPTIQSPPVPDVEVNGLWLDLHRLYVHEWHPIKKASACRLYDRRTGGLRTLPKCVTAGRPMRLQSGPGNLVAVHEASSAGPVLSVRRYVPESANEVVLRYDLRPDGVVALAFDTDGGALHLVSDCDLGEARPCVGPARLPALRHLRYDLLDSVMTALSSVSAGAVPGPGGRLAWPIPGGVCLRTPAARASCRQMAP